MRQVFSLLRETILPALAVVGIGYNVLVTLNSDEGLRMADQLDQRIIEAEAELAALDAEYARLSGHADRLVTATLDPDLLEERVRSVLGLVRREEYLVPMAELDALIAGGAQGPAPAAEVLAALAEDQPTAR